MCINLYVHASFRQIISCLSASTLVMDWNSNSEEDAENKERDILEHQSATVGDTFLPSRSNGKIRYHIDVNRRKIVYIKNSNQLTKCHLLCNTCLWSVTYSYNSGDLDLMLENVRCPACPSGRLSTTSIK